MNQVRCFHKHPPLSLGEGVVIYGGSCSSPVIKDADVYVGFDHSIASSPKAFPWEAGESFLYHIYDGRAPSDPASFVQLIDWLSVQLSALKKVHIGCIGGHGRTGMVLAALVKRMMGTDNAIQYVRDHYCKKAVETQVQVDFLVSHFGITSAEPARLHTLHHSSRAMSLFPDVEHIPRKSRSVGFFQDPNTSKNHAPSSKAIEGIWSKHVKFDKS